MSALLKIEDLKTHFPLRAGIFSRIQGYVYALDGVSLELQKGETLGLVGESGCGKSTLGKTVLSLEKATEGKVLFEGTNVLDLPKGELKQTRREMQMVFQDPFSSLDPRMSIENIITEPLKLHNLGTVEERRNQAKELLAQVGLPESALIRYPHEFSGGQRQRIGIARALALKPKLIIADEPVAALDVSVQAQVLNLMNDLKKKFSLTYLFISHDLGVVRYFSDRIAVMYLGKIVELGSALSITDRGMHPYTKALTSAIPRSHPKDKKEREMLVGDVPSPISPPSGCSFHTRCPYVKDICKKREPQLQPYTDDQGEKHMVSCHFVEDLKRNDPKKGN